MRTWNKYQPSLFRKDLEDFQRTHIIAATREVRPDIVRALFQYMKVGDIFYALDKSYLVEVLSKDCVNKMFVNLRVDETQHIYIESCYGVIDVETTQPSQRYSIHPTITRSLTLSLLMIYPMDFVHQ